MSVLSLKLEYSDKTYRRFSIPATHTFEELLQHLQRVTDVGIRALQYKDDETDWISVNSQIEWLEAIKLYYAHFAAEDPIMRLRVLTHQDERISNVNSKNSKTVHPGITCDGCGLFPLTGSRFKCQTCPDFDFCAQCYAVRERFNHGHHTFICFDSPVPRAHRAHTTQHQPINWGVICDGCNTRDFPGVRYKCGQCPNFDLCQSCFGKDIHEHDVFVKITPPISRAQTSSSRHCPFAPFTTACGVSNHQDKEVVLPLDATSIDGFFRKLHNNMNFNNVVADPTSNTSTSTNADDTKKVHKQKRKLEKACKKQEKLAAKEGKAQKKQAAKLQKKDKKEKKKSECITKFLLPKVVQLQPSAAYEFPAEATEVPALTKSEDNIAQPKQEQDVVVDAVPELYTQQQQEEDEEQEVQMEQALLGDQPQEEVVNYDEQFQFELQILRDMGFHDADKVMELLKKHNGDINAVVSQWLSGQNFHN